MRGLKIKSDKKNLIISLAKERFDNAFLVTLLERLQIEMLAKKADFDETILDVAKEIKQQWWQKNKRRFLKNDKP